MPVMTGSGLSLRLRLLFVLLFVHTDKATASSSRYPSVIIIGAGMSGISAGKTLSDAGIKTILILEATGRIGGRIAKKNLGGINVEVGANWVQGVNGDEMNPIWEMANKLNLKTHYTDFFQNIPSSIYQRSESNGENFELVDAQNAVDEADEIVDRVDDFSRSLPASGFDDISILTYQRLQKKVPSTPLEMAIDYYHYDYEFAEPPRVTSLQGTHPTPTFEDFGEDSYFVADQRGYELIVIDLAEQYLSSDNGVITDPRLQLNKVVTEIEYTSKDVSIKTQDGSSYFTRYVMVSPSIGVLQSDLIKFTPSLPMWKRMAISQLDMGVYTKIFLKFPYSFWRTQNNGTNIFLYASERRGYYPIWQSFELEYPGANVLMVTVTDMESKRIELQPDEDTKTEAMGVLRDMFGKNIPDTVDIYVPRWWSSLYFKGSFSNWPIGVNQYEYDQLRAPVGRVFFTGEHTSERYNGYVHGAYLAGIDSANLLINYATESDCDFTIRAKELEVDKKETSRMHFI